MIEYAALAFGVVGLLVGANGYWLARRWYRDCSRCRILIARKGRVVLDASLVEWLSWNKALPHREQSRGGIIFHANGIQVALARPKIGPAASTQKTTKGGKPDAPPADSSNRGPHRRKRSTTIGAAVE